MSAYKLSIDAENDLDEIWYYTFLKWSENKADEYLDELTICCRNISEKKYLWKKLIDIHPDLKYMQCKHHFIFFLIDHDTKPLIIAVLHERMDMILRVKKRL